MSKECRTVNLVKDQVVELRYEGEVVGRVCIAHPGPGYPQDATDLFAAIVPECEKHGFVYSTEAVERLCKKLLRR